jgi:hypothetical protein
MVVFLASERVFPPVVALFDWAPASAGRQRTCHRNGSQTRAFSVSTRCEDLRRAIPLTCVVRNHGAGVKKSGQVCDESGTWPPHSLLVSSRGHGAQTNWLAAHAVRAHAPQLHAIDHTRVPRHCPRQRSRAGSGTQTSRCLSDIRPDDSRSRSAKWAFVGVRPGAEASRCRRRIRAAARLLSGRALGLGRPAMGAPSWLGLRSVEANRRRRGPRPPA